MPRITKVEDAPCRTSQQGDTLNNQNATETSRTSIENTTQPKTLQRAIAAVTADPPDTTASHTIVNKDTRFSSKQKISVAIAQSDAQRLTEVTRDLGFNSDTLTLGFLIRSAPTKQGFLLAAQLANNHGISLEQEISQSIEQHCKANIERQKARGNTPASIKIHEVLEILAKSSIEITPTNVQITRTSQGTTTRYTLVKTFFDANPHVIAGFKKKQKEFLAQNNNPSTKEDTNEKSTQSKKKTNPQMQRP
jgi:hypothetical protein